MNVRPRLSDIKDRLSTITSLYVGTIFDRDYLQKYANGSENQVWLSGLKIAPRDSGEGYSSRSRQYVNALISVRIMVPRFIDGSISSEDSLSDLYDSVSGRLIGWQPPNCDTPLVWHSSIDGPGTETFVFSDAVFSTRLTYLGAP